MLALRHSEFLSRGARLFGLSADVVSQNNAVVEKLALPFPLLSDPERDRAITPLGFADEDDPRRISRPGTVVVSPAAEVVFTVTGRDYADRPNEDELLAVIDDLGLAPTTQSPPIVGPVEAGPNAVPASGLPFYFRGAKFAVMALRGRHRELGEGFRDDTKEYVQMVERYLDALPGVEQRRA